ncbi:tyrosine-type recombinase/integrase [Anaerobiospirillum sp. NML120449]|uniref:tyrosine-type recombinase/integrase n=1 Tax=Anaerobiospirillum sp. NML120449 TaxID=2932817 RepID=UPI001FF6E73A|nr:tyrosine-type recombinase/integrase [Anaerobiospirillum sp. NML120449]MCK0527717.1 tyrosine-type recombinase/integrase [Anaerobiospirillum sp. NML120449]
MGEKQHTSHKDKLAHYIHKYLENHFKKGSGMSQRTHDIHVDTFIMLGDYLESVENCSSSDVPVTKFNADMVIGFMNWYRNTRHASESSVGIRLSVLRLLARFLIRSIPENEPSFAEIFDIRVKGISQHEVEFLTVEQMREILSAPESYTDNGFRHKVALSILYDSGCRAQELCDLKVCDVSWFDRNAVLTIYGKGGKIRNVPLGEKVSALVKTYIGKFKMEDNPDAPLITNKYHEKLNRAGLSHIVKKYAALARKQDASIPASVHCHMFRHSKAMHMLCAGADLAEVKELLGHSNIATTSIYLHNRNKVMNQHGENLQSMMAAKIDAKKQARKLSNEKTFETLRLRKKVSIED